MVSLQAPILALLITFHLSTSCIPPRPRPTTTRPTRPTTRPTSSSGSCRCGIRKVTRNRIVGGQEAQTHEYPWQVALVSRSGVLPFCGGSLISSRSVLTAAHCKQHPSSISVIVGKHYTNRGGQRILATKWTSHPQYDPGRTDNDYAIITLAKDVPFSDTVGPVCLPLSSSINYDRRTATVTGWGTTRSGGSRPNALMEVDVDTMTNSRCQSDEFAYGPWRITRNMICAARPRKDSCQGDSGGPMVTLEGGVFDLIGVVSWGFGCAQANAPGVYSRVTRKLDWIKQEMSGETCQRN